jgi:hypothetical protein
MKSGKLKTILLGLVLAMLSGGAWLYAQVPQGQILGTVIDQGGAAVPDATVTLKNEQTGITRTVTTSTSGDYTFPALDSGTYSVTVQKTGFETVVSTDVKVQVEERRRVDVELNVGQVQTTIEVTGTASKVDTDSSTISTMISRREVKDLPLNGREFSQLATLVAGVRNVGTTGGALGRSFATAIAVGGTSAGKNEYTVDGADNTFDVWNGPAMNTSIDSIQEFRMDRSQFRAELGRGGAQIELVTRTGSNQFHGAAWEYLRNGALNAGNYITHIQDNLRRNQYGGNIGGPILKDKAFFFFNWEGSREDSTAQQLGTVLTAKMRTGDLSQFGTPIVDPQTGQAFAGGIIPSDRIDPIAVAYMNAMVPFPNLAGDAGGVLNNYIQTSPYFLNWDQYTTRIDYNLTDKDKLFGRFSIQPRSDHSVPIDAGSLADHSSMRFYNTAIGYTRSWTPRLMTETRLSSHIERMVINNDVPTNLPSQTISGYGSFQPPSYQLPIFFVSPYYDWVQWNAPWISQQTTFELAQNATYSRGKHLLKAGFAGRRLVTNRREFSSNKIEEDFYGGFTGNGVGDYFLGLPYDATEALPPTDRVETVSDYNAYVQDDWKMTPSLTLNVGLRYEIQTRPYERDDRWTSLDRETGEIVVAGDRIRTEYAVPSLLAAYAPYLVTAASTNLPRRTLVRGEYNDFAPRLGFAWRPFKDNKTVVRGGYGRFYILRDGNQRGTNDYALPYGGTVDAVNADPASFTMGAPFGAGTAPPPPPGTYWADPNLRDGYLQQFTLGIQHEFPWGMVGEVNYQHQLSINLETSYNVNQPPAAPSSSPQALPYPDLNPYIYSNTLDGRARYDAMEFSLKKSSTHYTFQWNHTWAKNLESLDRTNPYDFDMWDGPGDYAPQMDKLNFVLDLPFGEGRKWGNRGGVANQAVGGWTFSGIGILHQGGSPFTIGWNGDPSNTGVYVGRADRVCSGRVSNPTPGRWFDTACFVAPADGTFGNAGTGIFTGPGSFSYDLGLYKTFPVHESVQLQFRTELFNAFNHPNLAMPGSTANLGDFGIITTKNQSPRVIQFALRLEF